MRSRDQRSSVPAPPHLEEPVDARLERRGEREAERAALVQERRHRDLPALALVAEAVLDRDLDVVEEDLVELRLAGDLAQRPHLDAGRAHVDDQVREVPVALARPGRSA